jgi:hypothetical protein
MASLPARLTAERWLPNTSRTSSEGAGQGQKIVAISGAFLSGGGGRRCKIFK